MWRKLGECQENKRRKDESKEQKTKEVITSGRKDFSRRDYESVGEILKELQLARSGATKTDIQES